VHDPDVVAHEIRRPWPQRSSLPATGCHDGVRWRVRLHHDCGPWCADDPPHRTGAFPWWKPSSYMSHTRLAGRDFYWPPLVVVWHREPGGRDALSVCRRRWQRPDGTWRFSRSWRWHVWHWRLQFPPLQALRRWALTRCAWCGGPSRKGDVVNFSGSWGGPRGHWWQGEPGLFHRDCIEVDRAHRTCMCVTPGRLDHGDYGTCSVCGKFRPWAQGGYRPTQAERLLAQVPAGTRPDADTARRVAALWEAHRATEGQR